MKKKFFLMISLCSLHIATTIAQTISPCPISMNPGQTISVSFVSPAGLVYDNGGNWSISNNVGTVTPVSSTFPTSATVTISPSSSIPGSVFTTTLTFSGNFRDNNNAQQALTASCTFPINVVVTGPNNVTAQNPVYTYTLDRTPPCNLTWTVSGGSIVGPNSTASVSVRWSPSIVGSTGVVKCNISCVNNGLNLSNAIPLSVSVTGIKPDAPSLTGPTSITCGSQSLVTYSANSSLATNYTWAYPSGWILKASTTNSITLMPNGTGGGVVTAYAWNGSNQSLPSSVNVTTALPSLSIVGPSCISEVSGAVLYQLTPQTDIPLSNYNWASSDASVIIAGSLSNSPQTGVAFNNTMVGNTGSVKYSCTYSGCGTTAVTSKYIANALPLSPTSISTNQIGVSCYYQAKAAVQVNVSSQWSHNGGVSYLNSLTNYDPVELQAGRTYSVCVKSVNGCGVSSPYCRSLILPAIIGCVFKNSEDEPEGFASEESNFKLDDISLNPNPSTDRIIWLTNNTNQAVTLELFAISGELLLKQTTSESKAPINIESLAPGCYITKFESQGKTYHSMFVIH